MQAKVALVRGRFLSSSELINYDLGEKYDVTAIGAKRTSQQPSVAYQGMYSAASLGDGILFDVARTISNLILGSSTYMYNLEEELSNYDIIHTLETFHGFSEQAVKAKQKYGGKVVCTVFENIPYFNEPFHFSRTWKEQLKHRKAAKIKKNVIENVDTFIAVSDRAKTALEIEGVAEDKIEIVPLGIDTKKFKPGCSSDRMESLPGYLRESRWLNVVYVGRYTWPKGLFDILAAWERLKIESPSNAKLTLVGDGPAREKLDKFIRRNSIPDVSLCGSVEYENIQAVFDAADVTLLPSLPTKHWQEQFGRVILESQACGTPVIASRSGAIPYTLGEYGVLAQPGDPYDWSEKLQRLLEDETLRNRLGEQSRAFVEANRSTESIADRIKRLYDDLIE